MSKPVLELWNKLVDLRSQALNEEMRNKCEYYIKELCAGRIEAVERFLKEVSFDRKDDFLVNFSIAMKGKKFMKTLKESTDYLEMLKALFSLGTHLVIEAQQTRKDVDNYLYMVLEKIKKLLTTKVVSEDLRLL